MPQPQPLVATLYNPHTQTKQQLIDGFVVRLPLFRKLFADLKTAEMRYPEQHLLIEGQRGMGKTTLLLRLAYEIENDADTRQRLLPIIFEEEAYYRINRLFRLWEETAILLARRERAFQGLFEQMEANYEEARGVEWYEKYCFEALQAAVQRRGKKLILLIDNFSELCNLFSQQETQRLREVLMTCPDIRWVGATAGTLEVSFRYQHAFYEFFKKFPLTGLPRADAQELLLQLATVNGQEAAIQRILDQQPGRVETLRILTGGVIRTIVVLFEIFIDQDSGGAIHDLEKILDRVTPLYKHRMDDLPALQREVVTALAMNWDGMQSSEVAHKLRRPRAEVEATLAKLKELNLVEMKVVDTQTQWYFLEERFFNIWYLMRLATGARTRVIWLVRFLEAWYDREQLMERAKSQIRALEKPAYSSKAAFFYGEALAQTGKLDWELEHELTRKTREFLELRGDNSLARELSPADQELFEQAESFAGNEEYEQAKTLLLQIKQPDGEVYFRLGYCFNRLKNFSEAEHYYLMAINKGNYVEFKPAMKHMKYSVSYYSYDYGKFKGEFEPAMINSVSYSRKNKFHVISIEAMVNLAVLYHVELRDYSKAERYYLMAIDKGHTHTLIIFLLAILYHTKFKDYSKAEHYYLMALRYGEQKYALKNLVRLYHDTLNQFEKVEACLLTWAERGHPEALKIVAWNYFGKKNHKHIALCYAEQAFEKNKADYIAHTLACIYLWHNRFAEAVEMAKVFIDKEEFYERYLKNPESGVDSYLLLLLAKQQYTIVRDYFDNPQLTLKDRFKPIYYAFLKLTHDKEFGRMPPELEETVTQLLAKVEEMAKDYA